MCNKMIKYCGLNNINRDVQKGCTGYVHTAAMRMVENKECFTVY